MSFSSDYFELRKKKKKDEEKKVSGNSFSDKYSEAKQSSEEKDDIAPVSKNILLSDYTGNVVDAKSPLDLYESFQEIERQKAMQKSESDKEKLNQAMAEFTSKFPSSFEWKEKGDSPSGSNTWFQSGSFHDGYQFGDVTKAILGTAGDTGVQVVKGISRTGEGLADLLAYGVAGVADLFGGDSFAYDVKENAKASFTDELFGDTDKYFDQYSVLGDKSGMVGEGLGQLATIWATGFLGAAGGLGTAGTTALTMGQTGLSSIGSGMSEAYSSGASDEEALTYGLISGTAEILTEMLFGGLGKSINAVGFSKGLLSADDLLAKKVASKFSSQIAKNFAEFGIKAGAEGTEEVLSGIAQAFGKKVTYMSEKEWEDILRDENLLDQFIVATLTSGFAQSGIIPGTKTGSLVEANKTGRDFVTGLSQNEQKVVDKVYEDLVAEAEKKGEVSKKDKSEIYDKVLEDLEKGYLDTDKIEEVLGGDSYKTYKDTIDSEDAQIKQIEDQLKELEDAPNTVGNSKKYDSLQSQLEELKKNSQRDRLKAQLSKDVYELTKGGKLVESYFERVRANQKFKADLNQYTGRARDVIQKVMDSGLADNTNRTHEFWDWAAKMSDTMDTDITLANDEQILEFAKAAYESDGIEFDASQFDGERIDGIFSKNGIVLNAQSNRALNFVVGHEITHKLEGTKHYAKLQELLFEYAKDEYESRFKKRSGQYSNKFKADDKYKTKVDQEVTGDLVGDYIFNDKGFIDHLAKDQNVFRQVWNEIKYMAKIATAGSEQAKQLEKAKREFERAFREANKAQKAQSGTQLSDSNANSVMSREEYDLWRIDELNRLNPQLNGAIKGEIVDSDFLDGTSTDGRNKLIGSHNGSTVRRTKGARGGTFTHELLHTIDMLTGYNVRHYVEDLANGKGFDDYNSLLSYLKSEREQGKIDGRLTDAEEIAQMVLQAFYADRTGLRQAAPDFVGYLEGMDLDKYSHVAKNYSEYLADRKAQGETKSNDNRTKMSVSDIDTRFSSAEILAIQSIGQKSINNFTSQDIVATEKFAQRYWEEIGAKSPFYRAWFGDWRSNDKTPVQIATQKGDARGAQKNTDTGWDIQVSGKVFNETKVHTDSYNVSAKPYLPYINDIVKNAVLLDSYSVDPNKPKSQNSLLMHSMYAVADIGNGLEVLKLYVEEMNNPNASTTTKRSYQLQNIEKYRPLGKSSQNNTASSISPMVGSGITVADLFDYVKQLDKNFAPSDSSKIINADGTPKVMYHGSPAQFTVFDKSKAKSGGHYGKGFYFTDSTSHAGTYGNQYAVYLNIRNPLQSGVDTVSRSQVRSYLEAVAENEDYSIENYGTYDIDAILNNVMGKDSSADAFKIINDINVTAIGDMVEATELFNSVNVTAFDGIVVPTETVAFYPEQIKSATDNIGTFDKSNPDIRFSLSNSVEETKDLIALHNLTEGKLLKSLRLGGLPMPSVAIAKAQDGHEDFGEISLILPKETIDPKASRNNKLYSGDAWTPTYPSVAYKVDENVLRNISKKLYNLVPSNVLHELGRISLDSDNMSDALNRWGGDVVEAFGSNDALKYAYLVENGESINLPMKEKRISYGSRENGEIIRVAEAIPADEIKQALNGASEEMRKLEPRVRQAVAEYWQDTYGDDPYALDLLMPKEELSFSDLDGYLTDAMRYHRNGVEQTVDSRKAKATIAYNTNQKGYENWLKRTFAGIVEKEGIRNNKDYFTSSGNRRSFEALHYEHNLENVIKAMREKGEKGIGGFGGGSIFGAATTEFSSIEEMKNASDHLQKMSDEEYQAMRDEFSSRFFEIAGRLPNDKKSFVATDDAANTLVEAVSKYKTRSGIANYLRKELNGWATYSDQAVDDLIDLVNDIRNMPTGYFEAKPQRAVSFDEVGVFVIPRNADIKLKQELLNRGYSIAEYDPKVEGDRTRVLNQFEEYKFSLSNVGEQHKDTGGYQYYSHIPNSNNGTAPVQETAPVIEKPASEDVAPVAEDLLMDDLAPMEDSPDRLESLTDVDAPMDDEPMVETNIGRMPLSDYRDIVAQQNGFDDYADMRSNGIKIGNEYDTDYIAPVAEAPVAENVAPVKEAYEAIKPKQSKEPRMAKATPEEQAKNGKVAKILFEQKQTPKQKSAWKWAREHIFSRGAVFEDISLKTGNRELQAKFDNIRRAESMAQTFIGKGKGDAKALVDVRNTVEKSGKIEDFNYYLYHLHNVDRMTLEQRFKDVPNKSVFGDGVDAEVSRKAALGLEVLNPEFKQWAEDVYAINKHLRQMMVDEGVISQETADLWQEMYPHYVPISRADAKGLNVNVPLDSKRTGINAPIKKATGGNSDFYNVFDTMGSRIEQTYKAIAKNRFGVELMNTLGTAYESDVADIDTVLDTMDQHEELLQEGKNGESPSFTVFQNGERVKFAITEDMYDAMKPSQFTYTNKALKKINDIRRDILTTYSPTFALTNPIKDVQDILLNSQHPARTYATIPEAVYSVISKNHWYQERMDHGGNQDSYFDGQTKTFKKEDGWFKKVVGFVPSKIQAANEVIEQIPRMAEYIASRKMGRSIDVSMLDAARVTTNFGAPGDLTNMLNRNGFTFLGASVEGFNQQVRNVREAKAEGLKGVMKLAGKYLVAGLPAMLLNHLLWDDDEEYEELSDYVKQNYYVVGKTEDGKFIRIPKGRAVSVIQDAFKQMENLVTGNDDVDLESFGQLVVNNLAPNNPLENNLIAPIAQAYTNKTWYGDDLVPTRLQDVPVAEQFDETTDSISKWLGEATNTSPYKWNYLLDQYTGGVGDMVLPYLTPEADGGGLGAAFRDKFVSDPVLKNQNVSDFYDTMNELTVNANSSKATDEDVLKNKYMNSVNAELSELYKQKREIQNSDLSDEEKYAQVHDIQQQIVDLARESLATYENVKIDNGYATIGDSHYRWYEPGEDSNAEPGWQKISDKQLEKQEKVTSALGIDGSEYWSNKEEYDFAYESPDRYAVAKAVGGYTSYKTYSSELYEIKADKDANGKSISGSRKDKVADYINNLDIDYGMKIILFKSEYNADDTYNYEIIDYLNSREDIDYEEMETILKELGFDVSSDGTITWD